MDCNRPAAAHNYVHKFSGALSAPERVCNSTGPLCRKLCDTGEFGELQWCGACDTYLLCQDGTTSVTKCPDLSVYDDELTACRTSSFTCRNCFYGEVVSVNTIMYNIG